MRNLNYENPGTPQDLKVFLVNLELKSKGELLIILKHVAEYCDMKGKGYVSEFEGCIRHAIGYTQGVGYNHTDKCGCPRCEKEQCGVYRPKEK